MKHRLSNRLFIFFILLSAILLRPGNVGLSEGQKVRQPAVAGGFYPADPKELGKMLDEFLARAAVPEIRGPVVALVSPHAGYPYSGQVAAHAYALLKGKKVERVVVIAPSHFEAFAFASVYDGDAYATPLGNIPVDKDFAAKLAAMNPLLKLSDRGHTPRGQGEHALEVQLPFLQRVLGPFKLVPVVMGEQDYQTSRALGVALAKLLQGPTKASPPSGTLIVASSDLSHYHSYNEAVTLDRKALAALEEWDYLSMSQNFQRGIWEACGGGPMVAAMIAAERLGANQAKVLKYANSGDVTGDKSRVVGYGAVALFAEKLESGKAPEFSLREAEKEELLKIAKTSVETAVRERKLYQCSPRSEALLRDRGAFVTLKKKGQLRGCIGYISPVKPLCLTVRDVAAAAALEDRRFTPVTVAELGDLEYEVSVLSPLRRVTDIKQIRVGRDGLVALRGNYEGLLLPQVPVEQGWDRNTFLQETCVKAGLPPNAWKDEETDIFQFSALVFGEHKLPGPIIPDVPAFPKPADRPGPRGPDSPRP